MTFISIILKSTQRRHQRSEFREAQRRAQSEGPGIRNPMFRISNNGAPDLRPSLPSSRPASARRRAAHKSANDVVQVSYTFLYTQFLCFSLSVICIIIALIFFFQYRRPRKKEKCDLRSLMIYYIFFVVSSTFLLMHDVLFFVINFLYFKKSYYRQNFQQFPSFFRMAQCRIVSRHLIRNGGRQTTTGKMI